MARRPDLRSGCKSEVGLSRSEFNETLSLRFARKCAAPNQDGCISWLGTKTSKGYGILQTAGRASRKTTAHRIAWVIAYGDLNPGQLVLHRCDNPSCVNAAHLFIGSPKENTEDMVCKGRHPWRDGTPWQKLNDHDVLMILAMRREGQTQQEVADSFGVSRPLISLVEHGKVMHAAQVLNA